MSTTLSAPSSSVRSLGLGERRGPPADSAAVPAPVPARFLAGWLAAWAIVGGVVGSGIAFTLERVDAGPVLVMSLLFAEVVGFTALISARVIFPMFSRMPFAVRLVLQVMTLFGGTLFGSAVILWFQPLFSLARFRTVVIIVLVNAALAVIVGIALHTYDSMRRQIEASFLALREKEALERDLEIARDVQRELLPRSTPEIPGLQLAGVCIPAVGVGGDYYDYLPLGEQRLGLVIADVSGKGVPAALLMAGLQASVRSLGLASYPPSEINRRLNDIMHDSTSASRYATLCYCLYEGDSRTLTYCNAGHHPPVLLSSGEIVRLEPGGRPIGILDGSAYEEGRRALAPGDLLALFTDGMVESPNRDGEEFGEDRLVRMLAERRDRPLDDIVSEIIDALARWSEGTPRHDDVTLVLARVV